MDDWDFDTDPVVRGDQSSTSEFIPDVSVDGEGGILIYGEEIDGAKKVFPV